MTHIAPAHHSNPCEFASRQARPHQHRPSPLSSQHAPSHDLEQSTVGSAWKPNSPVATDSTRGSHGFCRSSEPDDWRRPPARDSAADAFPRALAAPPPTAARPASRLSPIHGPLMDVSNSKLDKVVRMPRPPNYARDHLHTNDVQLKPRSSSYNLYTSHAQENKAPAQANEPFAASTVSWASKPQTWKPARLTSASSSLGASIFSPPAAAGTLDTSVYSNYSQPTPQADLAGLGTVTSPLQSMGLLGRNDRRDQAVPRPRREALPFHLSMASQWASHNNHPPARAENPALAPMHNAPPSTNQQAGFVDFATRDAVMNGTHMSPSASMAPTVHISTPSRGLDGSNFAPRSNLSFQPEWPTAYDLQGSQAWDEHQRILSESFQARSGADHYPSLACGFHPDYPMHSPSTFLSTPQPGTCNPFLASPQNSEHAMEPTTSLRSTCLAEFRNTNKGTRRWELKDIYDHVVEFSGDHHGSLFIQSKLEKAKSEEKDRIFREIQPNAVPLMKDVFGNYVLQKFFEHGDHLQKKTLVAQMRGQVPELSKHVYGCRVVQTALDHILVEQQAALVRELEGCVMDCVKNENGNHVIQVAIKVVDMQHLQFMIDQLYGQIQYLATHRYGCRVIQRLLEHCQPPVLTRILQELHECSAHLIADQYGNYVPQHILEHGDDIDRNRIIHVVQQNLVAYSKQKFASNVVEKCVIYGADEHRRHIMLQLLEHDELENGELLSFLVRDGYGNYVVQSLLDRLNDVDYGEFVRVLESVLPRARLPTPNKQTENVAKKMQRFRTPRYGWNCAPSSGHQFGNYSSFRGLSSQISTSQANAGRSRIGSAVPTPPLSAGGRESPLSQAFAGMPDVTRQDNRKDGREWRKDSAITINGHG